MKLLQSDKVVTATINRALSCERSGATVPEVVKKEEDKDHDVQRVFRDFRQTRKVYFFC